MATAQVSISAQCVAAKEQGKARPGGVDTCAFRCWVFLAGGTLLGTSEGVLRGVNYDWTEVQKQI